MKRELPEGLRVRYKHIRRTREIFHGRFGEEPRTVIEPKGGETIARIIEEEHQTEVARGVAVCNPNDSYIKSRGRTIALGRALADIEKKAGPA